MNTFLGVVPSESEMALPRFRTKEGARVVDLRRIVYLSAKSNYTQFYMEDGEEVITSHSLNIYVELLEQYGFIRIHKSYLVNEYHLKNCRLRPDRALRLPNGSVLEVARRRYLELKKKVKSQRFGS